MADNPDISPFIMEQLLQQGRPVTVPGKPVSPTGDVPGSLLEKYLPPLTPRVYTPEQLKSHESGIPYLPPSASPGNHPSVVTDPQFVQENPYGPGRNPEQQNAAMQDLIGQAAMFSGGIKELPPGWKVIQGGIRGFLGKARESPSFIKPGLEPTEDPRTWFQGDVPQIEPPANLPPPQPGYVSGNAIYEAAQKYLKELQTKKAKETIPGFDIIPGGKPND